MKMKKLLSALLSAALLTAGILPASAAAEVASTAPSEPVPTAEAEDGIMAGSSMESYLRGELLSFSMETLALIWQETEAAYEKGESLLKQTIANETLFYGYQSLEEAELKHAQV